MKISLNNVNVVESYPYGRLRTEARFSVEFRKGKGFRSVFQTINPKNGRINNPKHSTYTDFMCMVNDNGFIKFHGTRFYDIKSIQTGLKFINENFDSLELSSEQMEEIINKILSVIVIDIYYKQKSGEDVTHFLNVRTVLIKSIKQMENPFPQLEKEFLTLS